MEEQIVTVEVEEKNPKQKVTAGRIVHLTAAIVFLVLATLGVVITMSFGIEYLTLRAESSNVTTNGEQLSNGLGQGFALVFMLVFGVIAAALSLVSIILSITVWRYRLGRERVFGIISTVLNGIYILATVAFPMVLVLIS